jgi:tetratricopeptide (TPR) repeat protein
LNEVPTFAKYICFWLICTGFGCNCKAQNIDSLKFVAAHAKHDTSKIKALLLLAQESGAEDILEYAEPALALSEQNLKKPALSQLLRKFYLEGVGSALTSLGYYYQQYANPSKALPFSERALKIYEQLKDEHCIANTLVGMGNAQMNLKGEAAALEYYNRALRICEKTKDSIILAPLLNNIGTVHNDGGRLAQALEYKHRSLKIYRAMNDRAGVARQLASISLVYQKRGEAKEAQQYNFEALEIAEGEKNKNMFEIARILHNIGHVYVSIKEWEKAKPFFTRSLEISTKLNDKSSVAYCLTGLAKIYMLQEQPDKALDYFKQGLKINEEMGNKLGTCVSLHNLCDFYLKTDKLFKASEYGVKALTIARQLNYPSRISASAKLLYKIYKKQNKGMQALEMYELHILHRDSVLNEESRKAAVATQMQYEFDKKEVALKAEQDKAILKFEKERAEMKAGSDRKKFLALIAFTSTGLIAAVLLLILVRNKSRKRQKQIEFEKNVLELEQQALRAQMNPHFIFNAINSIQNYILKRNKQEAYDYLAKFARLIRIVLNNSQEKDLLLHQELEMIGLYVELEQLRFNNFEFNLDVSERVNQFEIVVPAMLIQPYVENAICHGLMNLEQERRGVLNVTVTQKEGILKIMIEDNGIGRERSKQYKKADAHKSLGMAFTEQRLHVINKMQQYESAKVQITDLYDDDHRGIGTKVEIFIPVHEK